jgi:quercetin dioxygenase-like cupin family protein
MSETNSPVEVISHHFVGGVYCKMMRLKEDEEVVQHKHNYGHATALFSGCVILDANGEQSTHWAPDILEIKAGIHHKFMAINGDAVLACIHATTCTDADKVDEVLIQKQQHMKKLPFQIPVSKLNEELAEHPELWDLLTLRTQAADSPHREVSDIWLRYRSWDEFDPGNPQAFSDQHESIFYAAYYKLPAMEWILAQLVDRLGPFELGGILITKIPPGKSVKPHSDAGRWHSEYFSTKVLVLLNSAPGQQFCFENGEVHEGEAGEVFTFDNRPVHWVTNDSDQDRISLIFAIRKP